MFILFSFSVCLLVASSMSYFSDLIDSNLLDKTSGNDIIITFSKVFHFVYL